MRTFATGLLEKNRHYGFTLVEILVVIFILGLFTTLISIRIESALSMGDLRLASRMIISEINRLRGKAAYTHTNQVLGLNIDKNYLYTFKPIPDTGIPSDRFLEAREDGLEIKDLPTGVELEDVVIFSKGKFQYGEVIIRFFANGCVESSLIHLRNKKDEVYTLQINPVTGWVTIYDRYIDQKTS